MNRTIAPWAVAVLSLLAAIRANSHPIEFRRIEILPVD